jgi:hypothetical protein
MYTLQELREISARDLAALGLQDVAYVKAVTVDGKTAYAVHAADGTPIAVLADRDVAFIAVRQHELEPVSVH